MVAGEMNVTGFVLTGGQSRRMGQDKAWLLVGGVAMVVRTARLVRQVTSGVTVIGPNRVPESLHSMADDWPGAGPLGGIATALRVSKSDWNLIVACDLPYLSRTWLEYLVGRSISCRADAILPMNVDGAEPLCAMYHRRCVGPFRAALECGTRRVTDGLANVRIEPVGLLEWKVFDRDGFLFKNMNSPADYHEAKARLDFCS